MPSDRGRRRASPTLEILETRQAPSASPWLVESFDTTPAQHLPAGWLQRDSSAAASAGASSSIALSAPNSLALSSTITSGSTLAWLNTPLPADVQVGAAVFLNSLIPTQILARGSGLSTATPTYYALSLTRGLQAQLLRVVNGVSTSLGQIKTPAYFSQQWVRATLSVVGSTLQAQIIRVDTGQYLTSKGLWQSASTWAFQINDTALTGVGLAGLARPASYVGAVSVDDFNITLPGSTESFDTTATGSLPATWQQWSSSGTPTFGASSALSVSAPNGLAVTAGTSGLSARAWDSIVQPADVQVGAWVYLNNIIPAQVLARGSNLSSGTPSYYDVAITRGLQVEVDKVVKGAATALGQVTSAGYLTNLWVRVTLSVNGPTLKAQVYRPDTAQYLTGFGTWQSGPAWALSLTDTSLAGVGLAGVARPASYTGTTTFDDFSVLPGTGDNQPPTVTIAAPAPGSALTGVIRVQANATDNVGVTKVEFYVDNGLRTVDTAAPYQWDFDTSTASNGSHTLTVLAYDLAGNIGRASETITTNNNTALPRPTIPQHYPNIRIAELAYSGNPMGAVEDQLLQSSVDLVVADPQYLSHIHAVAPSTPLLIYTNASSIYQSLLTSWLNYADAQGISRESAFYHVSQATPFSGTSASSQPVDWFWGVYRGSATWTNLTSQAHGGSSGVTFGAAGEAVAVGYTDPFREIDLALTSAASGGWSAVLEYPTAVDSSGNPTTWAPLTTLTDTSAGLTRSGQITFDPPADWKTASIGGSARLYYVRFRTTTSGIASVASSILGRDYVSARGTTSGVIPAFDYAADTDHDGYLNDAEYAKRAPGKDARFVYESRAFAGSYGQMRFATNPADLSYRKWLIGAETASLNSLPLASGLFVDNSGGTAPVNAANVLETVTSYATDYGALLNAVGQAIAPKWLLANTAASTGGADAIIPKIQGYFEEFALRPLASTYQQFEDLAAQTAHRAALSTPAPYAVLDSLPTGGSPTDPRTQLATLAEYYLLEDPATTFLDPFGGFAPASTWSQHWIPAAAVDIGAPAGSWSLLASGADPSSPALTYHVYQRSFADGLVLYKPLSFGNNMTGTLSDTSATTLALGGTYRPLQADGTLGAPVTSISLRNGEGAILIKV
jgi:hypothetical protein